MKKLYLLFFILIQISCTDKQPAKTIRIHEKSNETVRYSQVFRSAEFVKLETRQECLVSNIATLKVDDDRIFVFDVWLGIVFIFSQDGHFIDKIGKKGKGPGEMITPRGFTLDKLNKQIEILDASGKKMLIFDYNGNYIKTNKSVYVLGFEKLTNSDYIGYSYNYSFANQEKSISSVLAIFNSDGQFIKEFKDITTMPPSLGFVTHSNLFLDKNNNAYIIPIFENSLFRVDPSFNIERIYEFVFDTNIPKGILEEPANYIFAKKLYSGNKYPYMIEDVYVVNDNVNFTFTYNRQNYHTFWKLNTNNAITVETRNFNNDLALVESLGFRGTFSEGIIDVVEAIDFIDIYTKAIEEDKELSVIQPASMKNTLTTLVKAISPNDNPILIFYTYKSVLSGKTISKLNKMG